MDTGSLRITGVIGMLIVLGMAGAGRLAAADPAADVPTPAPTDTSPAVPVDTAPAVPTRPQTPEEKALQARVDALEAPLAAAVSAGNAGDYATALNKFAARNCQVFSVSGQSVPLAKFLEIKRQAIGAQGPGLTETSKTLSLYITGPTALQTGVLTDDQDVADAAGTYGKKGATHHWQRLTFFRIHWAQGTPSRTSSRRAAANSGDWTAQEIAFTGIQTFLDGSPYIPPSAKKNTTRRNTTRATTPKTTTKKRTSKPRTRTRVYPYVITGGQTTTF